MPLPNSEADSGSWKSSSLIEVARSSRQIRRQAWFDDQLDLDPDRLGFIEETCAPTQDGPSPRPGAGRAATQVQRVTVSLEHVYLRGHPAAERPHRSDGHARPQEQGLTSSLCSAGAGPGPEPRRHREHGQPHYPKEHPGQACYRDHRRKTAVPGTLQPPRQLLQLLEEKRRKVSYVVIDARKPDKQTASLAPDQFSKKIPNPTKTHGLIV